MLSSPIIQLKVTKPCAISAQDNPAFLCDFHTLDSTCTIGDLNPGSLKLKYKSSFSNHSSRIKKHTLLNRLIASASDSVGEICNKSSQVENGSLKENLKLENANNISEQFLDSSSQKGLIDGGCAFEETFKIRCYEVGMNRTASIESIANLMQETACNHVLSIGFSSDGFAISPKMKEKKLIWAMTRMHIEMEKYPLWGDVIRIETWFQTVSTILAGRDWIIRMHDSNEIIGRATSLWVMMNEETRRLARIPLDIKEEYVHFSPNPSRMAIEDEKSGKIEKLDDKSAQFLCSNLMPRRGDLDMNRHVNNVTYISWMLSSIPSYLYNNAEIEQITLEYRQECMLGDSVESMASFAKKEEELESMAGEASSSPDSPSAMEDLFSSSKPVELTHLLQFSDGSKKELNRGRTVWRIKSDCRI